MSSMRNSLETMACLPLILTYDSLCQAWKTKPTRRESSSGNNQSISLISKEEDTLWNRIWAKFRINIKSWHYSSLTGKEQGRIRTLVFYYYYYLSRIFIQFLQCSKQVCLTTYSRGKKRKKKKHFPKFT